VRGMRAHRGLPLLFGLLLIASPGVSVADDPAPADENKPGEQVERHLSGDQTFREWSQSPDQVDKGDRLETRPVVGQKLETVKMKNVVPPIHFESGVAKIPPDYVDRLARILESMRYRKNVRVHFVGHADSQRLSGPLARAFGDNMGLSRERAG